MPQESLFPIFSKTVTKSKIKDKFITLAHGSGGKAMHDLINNIFVEAFDNPVLAKLEDQATLDIADLIQYGNKLAFTTDSYVIDPLFFPGGDIGTLAINGTVNDLAMSGAKPLYLTCGFILEEGLSIDILRKVVNSMQIAANQAGVKIVAGDTKVVQRGSADKLFINTAGIGVISSEINVSTQNIKVGDVVIVNGELGNHGTAILIARGELALETSIKSDCQALNNLVETILDVCPEVHAMRDITRGGLATVLNEFALATGMGISLEESLIPVSQEVRGICEILGLDPLYIANEGKLVIIVAKENADSVLAAMKSHSLGENSAIIGEVVDSPSGLVLLKTDFGAERIVDMLIGEQLPRIC
jgi:hydrogenase expression/formation protein HypE